MGYMMSRDQAFAANSERYQRRRRQAGHDYEAERRAYDIGCLERFAERYGDVAAFADTIREIPQKIADIRAAGPVGCSCLVCQEEAQ